MKWGHTALTPRVKLKCATRIQKGEEQSVQEEEEQQQDKTQENPTFKTQNLNTPRANQGVPVVSSVNQETGEN